MSLDPLVWWVSAPVCLYILCQALDLLTEKIRKLYQCAWAMERFSNRDLNLYIEDSLFLGRTRVMFQ